MADQIGAYHLIDNPELYEVMRDNTFEFVVTGIDNILKAGATAEDENAYIKNASEVLRFSVVTSSIPFFSQEPIVIRRGNSVMKAAGMPSFTQGQISVLDYIGADTKSTLMAWQNLSYNVKTQKVGAMKDYKKTCYLLEKTPDYQVVRRWKIMGGWISGLSEDNFSAESGNKKTITATIEFDYAYMELDDTI